MSLQLRLFGGGNSDAGKLSTTGNDGGHTIDKATVLKATSPDALSPMNPGNFASGERSVPIVPAPRYFDKEEAAAMKTLAAEKEKGVKYAKKAYTALERIEVADTKVHRRHRKYERVLATNELQKVTSNAGLAKHLHGLRPGYAKAGVGIDKADNKARTAIDAIKAQLTGGSN